ncbi:NAD(P)-dependent oxidoreductase [Streptomyces sp. NPDC086519]|uniref:NAD(P)-dependent oxidoreductase n=1 Tax=Streptomyces sp. NPDC086519 TaxID=3154863 RepID=UPI00342700A4
MADAARPRALVLADDFADRHVLRGPALDRLARSAQVTVLPAAADEETVLAELRRSTALFALGWAVSSPRLDRDRLADAPGLRYIGAGQDGRWRFVDVPAALSRGVVCSDASGAMGPVVAEFAFALAVCALRDLPRRHNLMAAGGWWDGWEDGEDAASEGCRPSVSTVFGSRVGIVGFGRIGSHAAALFRAAGAEVTVHSSWLPEREASARGLSLAASVGDLAKGSDILVVATQPRHDTAGLVSADVLDALPDGALVVLVGRASTVDTTALLAHVAAGRLRLGVDVYEEEPLPAHHRLRGMPGVVHTSHVAGRTLAAHRLVLTELVADFERVLAGSAPRWATTADRVRRVRAGRPYAAPRTAVGESDS